LLYKPFDPIFKSQYDQIYYLYIKEGSIASVNLNSEVVAPIEDQMENNNYSYLMYNQVCFNEVSHLLTFYKFLFNFINYLNIINIYIYVI